MGTRKHHLRRRAGRFSTAAPGLSVYVWKDAAAKSRRVGGYPGIWLDLGAIVSAFAPDSRRLGRSSS